MPTLPEEDAFLKETGEKDEDKPVKEDPVYKPILKKAVTGLITVSKIDYKRGEKLGEEAKEETIEIQDILSPIGQVSYEASMTINLGNFESTRIHIACTLPAYVEQIEDAFAAAKQFVSEKLGKEVAGVRESVKKRSAKGEY